MTYTTPEAAKMLQVSETTLRSYIRDPKFAMKPEAHWRGRHKYFMWSEEVVESYRKTIEELRAS